MPNDIKNTTDIKDEFLELIIQKKMDVNARYNSSKLSALHHAIIDSRPEIVKLLLELGADIYLIPEEPHEAYWTVLFQAVGNAIVYPENREKNYQIIDLILDHEYKIRSKEREKYGGIIPTLTEREDANRALTNPIQYAFCANQAVYKRLVESERKAREKYFPEAFTEPTLQQATNDVITEHPRKTRNFMAKVYSKLKGFPHNLTHFSPAELEPFLPKKDSNSTNPSNKKNDFPKPRY